jgi:pimeloyl-ACP methyl ester carboxylesterase
MDDLPHRPDPDDERPLAPRSPPWPDGVGPAIARRVGDAALGLTFRVIQARAREAYTATHGAPALTRIYYTTDDGWRAPLFHVPAAPGSSGEPVLLAHGLGGTHLDFSLEEGRCLAATLARHGFAVYLLEHRGDRSALPPEGARPFTVDDIAQHDLGAALDAVRAHSGFDRVLCVGHALGAQALYLRLALAGAEGIAGLVTLCGAVRFSAGISAARNAGLVAALLPGGWVLPGRRLQQIASPFVSNGEQLLSPDTSGPVARARLRYAAGDLHGGVVRQMARWVANGHLTDASGRLDVTSALRPLPALVFAGDDDPTCPPMAALPAAEALDAPLVALQGGWGHLDPLLGTRAPVDVHPRILSFLGPLRRRCWD